MFRSGQELSRNMYETLILEKNVAANIKHRQHIESRFLAKLIKKEGPWKM